MESLLPLPSTPDAALAQQRRRVVRAWIPAILWLGVIAVESTSLLSSGNTASWLFPVLRFLFPTMPQEQMVMIHHLLRKTGHVFGYGMLSWLLFRAWRETQRAKLAAVANWASPWAIRALLMCAAVASLDELHQFFTPGRTGLWQDVVLDSAAALMVQLIVFAIFARRNSTN